METVTESDLIRLAIEAGFMESESTVGLSGESELDEAVVCEEYPVGETLKRFVESLGITVIKE